MTAHVVPISRDRPNASESILSDSSGISARARGPPGAAGMRISSRKKPLKRSRSGCAQTRPMCAKKCAQRLTMCPDSNLTSLAAVTALVTFESRWNHPSPRSPSRPAPVELKNRDSCKYASSKT
jgi:hypothetical protein